MKKIFKKNNNIDGIWISFDNNNIFDGHVDSFFDLKMNIPTISYRVKVNYESERITKSRPIINNIILGESTNENFIKIKSEIKYKKPWKKSNLDPWLWAEYFTIRMP